MNKIYCFANRTLGSCGDVVGIALADDGVCLGSHICSNEQWILNDLGVNEGARPDRHKTYAKHYPDGYEMEFVPEANIENHAALQAIFAAERAKDSDMEK